MKVQQHHYGKILYMCILYRMSTNNQSGGGGCSSRNCQVSDEVEVLKDGKIHLVHISEFHPHDLVFLQDENGARLVHRSALPDWGKPITERQFRQVIQQTAQKSMTPKRKMREYKKGIRYSLRLEEKRNKGTRSSRRLAERAGKTLGGKHNKTKKRKNHN